MPRRTNPVLAFPVSVATYPGTVCSICTEKLSLETSKTDECGKAVHESCYVQHICETKCQPRAGSAKKLEWHRIY
jgi:hypothetical protein